jgi:hypothetical protein
MRTVTLNEKQQRRSDVVCRLRDGVIDVETACDLLGLGRRQVRRVMACYVSEGLPSVVHGNTGRVPANKTPTTVRARVSELAGADGVYRGLNTCHMQEMLATRDGIQIGRSTLDRLLVADRVRKRGRGRPRRVYRQRDRCPKAGDMLLTDGSPFDWLEGRDPRYQRLCLLGSMDDATGDVLHLRFWPTECQAGYITMVRDVVLTHGIPMRFYHDRHTILCSPKAPTIEDELAGRAPMSQFQEILAQLGTESIKAMTPQAKGRIERLWRTLQDRLVQEMRLDGVASLEDANAFLPEFIRRFNARFSVPAQDPDSAWVEAGDIDPSYHFAAKECRTVRPDHTVAWKGTTLRLARRRGDPSLAGQVVAVHTTPEGDVAVYDGRQRLAHSVAPQLDTSAQRQVEPTHAAKQTNPPKRTKPSDSPGTRVWLFANS